MSTTRVAILTNGHSSSAQGFLIHTLPANKAIAVTHAIRDSEYGTTLLIDQSGKIYSPTMAGRRSWSWRQGVSTRVARALAGLGVITKEQAASHEEARAAFIKKEDANCSLKNLEELAARYEVKLSGRGLTKLRKLAGGVA